MNLRVIMTINAFAGLLLLASCTSFGDQQQEAQAPDGAEHIRLNQIGFYPDAPKRAVITAAAEGAFYVTTPDLSDTLFRGELSEKRINQHSQKATRIADFSSFTQTGTYVVAVPSLGHSYTFAIQPQVHQELVEAAIKGFYYQRTATELLEAHAGKWARPAGHPDREVQVHPSAASAKRPAGTVIASPGGWYDAGDYNKYIVNSGITMGTLLSAYEDFPDYYNSLALNIPESSNTLPDLLDEVLWNLRWMLTMQDPTDGGVYHKLTTANFEGMRVQPHEASNTRYVVKKSTTAALDFAAVMAQASRIFKAYEQELPGLSDSTLVAAKKAWQWAQAHPKVLYDQTGMNKQFDPDITTGAYDDQEVGDEWIWAASELYVTTKDEHYYKAVNMFPATELEVPSWSQVRLLGYYSLARAENELQGIAQQELPKLKQTLITFADRLSQGADGQAYHMVMGLSPKHFVWGSSAVAANQGIALLQAYRISQDKKYLNMALNNLDYLLGRNATGYSFVTGHGDKTPMYPHHRPSESDEVAAPVPGLLAGGPNPGQQDKCDYPSNVADESYTDHACSYASNEIAINWNAPLVYLAGAVEALQQQAGYTRQ